MLINDKLVNGTADLEFLRLWDTYHNLLTANKQEITNLYFNCDLSLSEIAEEKGITRQAVSDCLKACKKQLKDFDKKLNFISAIDEVCLDFSAMMTDALRWAEEFEAAHPEFSKDIQKLKSIIIKEE